MRARHFQNDKSIHYESVSLDTWNEQFLRNWDEVVVHHQYLGSVSVCERTLLMEAQLAIQCLLSVRGRMAKARACREMSDLLTAMSLSGWSAFWHGSGRRLILLTKKDHHTSAP
jgi:hypothetical protein